VKPRSRHFYVSDHAIQQFQSRWRPSAPLADCRRELVFLMADAAATKRRTASGDAWIYIATTAAGERIALAVRDKTVVTVIPEGREGMFVKDMGADEDLAEESRADREACLAMASVKKEP